MTGTNDKSASSYAAKTADQPWARLRGLVGVLIALAVISGCGSDEKPSGPKTSESSKNKDTVPTAENTLELLPRAADLSGGFEAKESVDADLSPALRQGLSRCDAALGLVDSIPSPVHRQGYIDAQGRILEVLIDFPAKPASAETYRAVDTLLRGCKPHGFQLGTTEIGATIAGGADEKVGDQAFRVAVSLTAQTDGQKVTQNFYLAQFIRDGIGIQIRALDAVKGNERVRFDPEVLIAASTRVDEAILAMKFATPPPNEATATPKSLILPESSLKKNFRVALSDYLSDSLELSEAKVACVVPVVLDTISDAAIKDWLEARANGEEEPAAMVSAMKSGADACTDVD